MARHSIRDLQQKIEGLRDSVVAQRVGGYSGSNNSFGEATVGRNSLRSILERKTSGLEVDHERIFSGVCGFRVDWPEWQTGTADEFIKRYEREHKRSGEGASGQKNEPTPVMLVEDIFAPRYKYETELASVQPRFAQMEPVPGEVTLTFDLNCKPLFADDERTGVKRGILVFRCGDARTTKAEKRTGYPNGVEIDGLRISIRSVDQNVPSWMIESIEGNNIGLIARAPDKFIRIVNMKPGYVISVEFCAYVKDIASTFDLSESGDTSAAKRKIKKRLSQMSLKEGEQGTSLLAKAEMHFIEGEV